MRVQDTAVGVRVQDTAEERTKSSLQAAADSISSSLYISEIARKEDNTYFGVEG